MSVSPTASPATFPHVLYPPRAKVVDQELHLREAKERRQGEAPGHGLWRHLDMDRNRRRLQTYDLLAGRRARRRLRDGVHG